jgi:hypothetical protein
MTLRPPFSRNESASDSWSRPVSRTCKPARPRGNLGSGHSIGATHRTSSEKRNALDATDVAIMAKP